MKQAMASIQTSAGKTAMSPRLAALRETISRLEGGVPCPPAARQGEGAWTLGLREVDAHLPADGLDAAGVHEVAAEAGGDAPATLGFATALALRLLAARPADTRPVLWCRLAGAEAEWGRLHGTGLESLGLPRERLITVRLPKAKMLLWTVEEALRSGALALVLADGDGAKTDLTAVRRLMLAATAGGTPGLLVFPSPVAGGTAARSRWLIRARLSKVLALDAEAPGLPAWRLALERCRGGKPGRWLVEWNHATHRFALAAAIADRPAEAGDLPRARPAVRAGHAGERRLAACGLR